jgi:hypothetical protein
MHSCKFARRFLELYQAFIVPSHPSACGAPLP